MRTDETRAALLELSRAADRLASLLTDEVLAEELEAFARPASKGWVSPTVALEPVVVMGEQDLASALQRGHTCLVVDGPGGLVSADWSEEERLRLLAVSLAGDVALEAAHAGVTGSRSAVDSMLRRGFEILVAAALAAALPTPTVDFIASVGRFSELDARGAEWR